MLFVYFELGRCTYASSAWWRLIGEQHAIYRDSWCSNWRHNIMFDAITLCGNCKAMRCAYTARSTEHQQRCLRNWMRDTERGLFGAPPSRAPLVALALIACAHRALWILCIRVWFHPQRVCVFSHSTRTARAHNFIDRLSQLSAANAFTFTYTRAHSFVVCEWASSFGTEHMRAV